MSDPKDSPRTSTASRRQPLELVYVVERFPADTLNFVYNEIDVLEEEDIRIHVYSLLPCEYCPDEARKYLERTTAVKPVPARRLLASLTHYAVRRPLTLVDLLVRFPLANRNGFWRKWPRSLSHVVYGIHFAHLLRDDRRHIHAHFAHKAATAAYCAARLNRTTFSFTAHGSATIHPPSRYSLEPKVRGAAFIIAISDYNKRKILEVCPDVPADRIVVNHTGVRLADFPFEPGNHARTVKRILCLASLYPIKNHEGLLDACGLLRERGLPFRLDLVGKDDTGRWPGLRARAEKLGILPQVTYHGVADHTQVQAWLREADLVVLSSHSEGIPVALMEAMALGTPVVGPRVTGLPELVREGATGWLAAPGCPEELAAVFAKVIDGTAPVAEIRTAARRHIEAEFDMLANARTLAGVFRSRVAAAQSAAARR